MKTGCLRIINIVTKYKRIIANQNVVQTTDIEINDVTQTQRAVPQPKGVASPEGDGNHPMSRNYSLVVNLGSSENISINRLPDVC